MRSTPARRRFGQRLVLLGDLKPDAAPAANADVYGGALVEGVKRFQGRHGLDADGQLGPGTVKQLNVPIADRVRQLQLALERWRWLPTEFSAPPIIVNIPDFQLRAADAKGNVAMDMRVVVGKAAPTQTPVFSRDMTYVVFRPYWNVPPSILRGEIVPRDHARPELHRQARTTRSRPPTARSSPTARSPTTSSRS